MEDYLRAFNELSAGRPWVVGMGGGGPLPITAGARMDCAIERDFALGSEEYDEFGELMRALDQVWLEDYAKKHPPKK